MKLNLFILAILTLSGCKDPSDTVFPAKQWVEATPEEVEIDSETLLEAVNFLEHHSGRDGTRELMIIRMSAYFTLPP
jgi:hypothetical protein